MLTFILLLFQKRFFESRHFSKLAENAKITAVLASKMYITVQEWGRKRKDENHLLDLKSIMKIKEKVNKLRKDKERITKRKETHFAGTYTRFYDNPFVVNTSIPIRKVIIYWLYQSRLRQSFFYKLHRKLKPCTYTCELFFLHKMLTFVKCYYIYF